MKRVLLIFLLLAVLPLRVLAAGPEVPAKSACLMDVATGTVLYEQNADEPLAPASVTKVMTMLLIMEAIDDGKIAMEDTVTASQTAADKGGSQVYLKAGETMTVSDMLKSIAVSSANDCACAMAEYLAGSEAAFVEKMNARAAQLGMKNTHFVNCTGLDDGADAKDHRTTARDIAIMSRQLLKYHPKIKDFTTIWMDTIRGGTFGLSNTNKLVRFYTGTTGLKTGFTSAAGYCLSASAQRDGMELVAVVMGAETSAQRFSGCKALLDYGFAEYTLYYPQLEPQQVPVLLGKQRSVTLIPPEDLCLLIKKGERHQIQPEITLSPGQDAPVEQGAQLGTLTLRVADEIRAQIPLTAENTVEKLTWLDVWTEVLKALFLAPSRYTGS